MARISKKGLDYFPMNTHFMQERVVRRLMKQEGDRALCILLAVYSFLYEGEGYYLEVDDACYGDIAANFYNSTAEDVKRVVEAAVSGGLFDADIYARFAILTSVDIQEQYLFIKKRSKKGIIRDELRLLSVENEEDSDKSATGKIKRTALSAEKKTVEDVETELKNVTFKPQNATLIPQRKEKERKENKTKEKNTEDNLLLNPPPLRGEDFEEMREEENSLKSMADNKTAQPPEWTSSAQGRVSLDVASPPLEHSEESSVENSSLKHAVSAISPMCGNKADTAAIVVQAADTFTDGAEKFHSSPGSNSGPNTLRDSRLNLRQDTGIERATSFVQTEKKRSRKVWTMEDIRCLTPPSDGAKRNYSGLLESLRLYSIPPDEQYAIIRKSNFGVIGHPVWKGLYTLSSCNGKIKLPGRYLLSLF